MRRIFTWAGAVLVGLVLGAGSAWWALSAESSAFVEHLGPWSWSRATGSTGAGPYTRAIIARDALLALNADEALYLNLDRDENGRPLQEACIYELSGGDIPARWWSVTLYAKDNYLARNDDHAFSIDATRVRPDENGRWSARISAVRGEAPLWISSRSAGRDFSLTLRAYIPADDFPSDASQLPSLRTLSCPDSI